eukprot:776525-Amphidinium_carterae.1
MTGYKSISSHFPVVVEKYWNRLEMLGRTQPTTPCESSVPKPDDGKEMVDAMIPELPELKAIQPERRCHRFRMAKSYMLNEDCYNEITERCQREREESYPEHSKKTS